MALPKPSGADTTPDTDDNSRKTGFTEGYDRGRESENTNSAGLMVGLLIALVTGLGAASWYLLANSKPTTPERVIVVPSPTILPSSTPAAEPEININIPTPVLLSPAPTQSQQPESSPAPRSANPEPPMRNAPAPVQSATPQPVPPSPNPPNSAP